MQPGRKAGGRPAPYKNLQRPPAFPQSVLSVSCTHTTSPTMFSKSLRVAAAFFSLLHMAAALGSTCTTPISSGTAAATDPFWMQNIVHQGESAFNADPSTYTVFRNVKDYGATGNGVTDDTAAIKYVQGVPRCTRPIFPARRCSC